MGGQPLHLRGLAYAVAALECDEFTPLSGSHGKDLNISGALRGWTLEKTINSRNERYLDINPWSLFSVSPRLRGGLSGLAWFPGNLSFFAES
jgi:hypothetical protein